MDDSQRSRGATVGGKPNDSRKQEEEEERVRRQQLLDEQNANLGR
jgi:hypothetical protein